MIDSHCHLADKKFDADLAAVIDRARGAGVSPLITIADSLPEAEKCIAIAEKFENVFCTVGVHPHCAKDWKPGDGEKLIEVARSHPRVKAIGEIGLDYHYDFSPRETQGEVFADQLTIATELDLPVVVHCREAVEDIWAIVRDSGIRKLVLHCCTEKFEDIEPLIDNGFFLSFTGIATYNNAEVIRDCIKRCPLERMMIETDAPYLAPIPHRGKRNEPAFVVEVAKLIAKLKDVSLEEVDVSTTKNAVDFFGLSESALVG